MISHIETNSPPLLKQSQAMRYFTIAVSVVIPIVVAVLFRVRLDVEPLRFLPPLYATINAATFFILISAYIAIRRRLVFWHVTFIRLALVLSTIFLICYVAYHMTSSPTLLGDLNGDQVVSLEEQLMVGWQPWLYYPLLISHIILSVAVVPLVLTTYSFARYRQFDRHKKWAKITLPIWLYVTISGVIVYLMISPFYPS